MAREKGVLGISSNFEPQKAAPFDARFIADTKADLILTATWTANDSNVYAYKGMFVSVHSDTTDANNGIWRLKDDDYTVISNWEQVGASAETTASAIYPYVFGSTAIAQSWLTSQSLLADRIVVVIDDTLDQNTILDTDGNAILDTDGNAIQDTG